MSDWTWLHIDTSQHIQPNDPTWNYIWCELKWFTSILNSRNVLIISFTCRNLNWTRFQETQVLPSPLHMYFCALCWSDELSFLQLICSEFPFVVMLCPYNRYGECWALTIVFNSATYFYFSVQHQWLSLFAGRHFFSYFVFSLNQAIGLIDWLVLNASFSTTNCFVPSVFIGKGSRSANRKSTTFNRF